MKYPKTALIHPSAWWRISKAANRSGLAFRVVLAEGDAKIFELTKA